MAVPPTAAARLTNKGKTLSTKIQRNVCMVLAVAKIVE
jgi:hypothetical protein